MKVHATVFVLLIACAGCQKQRGRLHSVVLTDGISQSEAVIIAECYSTKHLGDGEITSIRDGGDRWIVAGRLGGYLAKPLSFDIDKHSGMVTSQVGPSYDSPLAIYP